MQLLNTYYASMLNIISLILSNSIIQFVTVLYLGVYFSIKLNLVQIKKLPLALKIIVTPSHVNNAQSSKKTISSFSAFAAVIGGNLGTGNIAGVAVAIYTGGAGAIFWMWVMGFLGAVIKFAGSYLGVKYRKQTANGFVGGPMYYLRDGLGKPWLAKVYCIATIVSAIIVGSLVQVNSISQPLIASNINPLLVGLILSILIGLILLSGRAAFAKFTSRFVPFISLTYIFACLFIVLKHAHVLPNIFTDIIHAAFAATSIAGGIIGVSLIQVIKVGFSRGLFATDAGLGIAPILHAEVYSHPNLEYNALQQALISIVAPIIVIMICTLTALVLLIVPNVYDLGLTSTKLCIHAFQYGFGHNYAGYIVIITLCLFAFSSILTWFYVSLQCVNYLSSKYYAKYLVMFIMIITIPLGCVLDTSLVWKLADIILTAMLMLNLFAVYKLRKQVVAGSKHIDHMYDELYVLK